MDFTHYPDDSRLYFIRWIDRYTKPHKASTSTSVCCYLVPLPDDIKDPARATPDQIAKLFGYTDQAPFVAKVLVGALPSIRIGYVYCDRKRVGVLPSQELSLGDALSNGEGSGKYGRSIQLDSVIGKDGDFPIKAVPTSQLHLEHSVRFRSGVLIAEDSGSGIEFLIPRSLIFRTFYARSTYLASVFTMGIWDETVGKVIFLDKEFAGNWTREVQDPRRFHLVMQRGMRKGDAVSVALLHFFPYGKAAANTLYTPMLKAQNDAAFGGDFSWYSNAQIPMDPDLGPYSGRVMGYYLTPHRGRRPRKTFLVTSFLGFSLPRDFPEMGDILVNDGNRHGDLEHSDGPSPYGGAPDRGGKRPNGMQDNDGHNGSTTHEAFDEPSDTFEWINAPPRFDLVKDHSAVYTEPRRPGPNTGTEDGSFGDRDGAKGSKSALDARLKARASESNFTALLEVLDAVKADGVIAGFGPVYPQDPTQRVPIGSCVCWNFLDELERAVSYDQRVRRGWAFLHQEGRRSGGLERGALVVSVTLSDGRNGFWIEIQTRQGAMTPLVIDDGSDTDAQISRALNIIYSARGSNLDDHFHNASMKAYCFTHRYLSRERDEYEDEGTDDGKKKEHKKEWDKDWLIAFFKYVSSGRQVAGSAVK
ncbi:hypothetical protein [Stenotrophomonas chelatiphaga]|uniref:hypothetical protein n=1 Tax=Stenotrophomonas chelatiphaga TaxID=517011 RepID=UPI0028989B2D|nr:hypothetical protein [Stenotrophomonas chelatiphaga]